MIRYPELDINLWLRNFIIMQNNQNKLIALIEVLRFSKILHSKVFYFVLKMVLAGRIKFYESRDTSFSFFRVVKHFVQILQISLHSDIAKSFYRKRN